MQSFHKRASVAVRRVSKVWLVLRHSQSKRLTASAPHPRCDHRPRFQERDCHIFCLPITPQALWILKRHLEFSSTNNSSFASFTKADLESLRQFARPTIVRPNAVGALLTTMKFHNGIVASVNMCYAIVTCAFKVLNCRFQSLCTFSFIHPNRSARRAVLTFLNTHFCSHNTSTVFFSPHT